MDNYETIPRGYKVTELGILPEEWKLKTIGEVASLNRESMDFSKESPDKYFKYIDISSVEGNTGRILNTKQILGKDAPSRAKRVIHTNDVIISTVRPYLKAFTIIPEIYDNQICSTGYVVLTVKDEIIPEFLLFVTFSDYITKQFEQLMRGANYPAINPNHVKDAKIPLPSIPIQRKIAGILSAIQEVMEKTVVVIDAAKNLKKSLMKYLFTYGPVPVSEAEKVPLKETEIGMMPEKWEISNLGNYVTVQGGYAFKSNDYISKGVRLFKISNVSFGRIKWDDVSYLPDNYINSYADYLLKENDIVMAMTRPVVSGGIKISKVGKKDIPCLLNQRVCRFKIGRNCDKDYILHALSNEYFKEFILGGATGSQQPNISAQKIESIPIAFPSLEVQIQISEIINSINFKIEAEENRKKALGELFKTLLENLMTGRIRVDNEVSLNE